MTMLADAVFVALAAAALTLQTPMPTAAQPANDLPPDETWSISGRVTDRETGQPLPRARVGVYFGPGDVRRPPVRATVTDARGNYELAGLAAGSYTVIAQPPPYVATHLPQAYGFESPFDPLSVMYVAPQVLKGQSLRDVDIALVRSGAIEGRVVNGDGEPLAGIAVAIVRNDRAGGEPIVRFTDDRGLFRHFGLQRGAYRICASEPAAAAATGDGLRRACYLDGKETVPVGSTLVSGVEIRMTRGATATISGLVLDASGEPLEQAHLEVVEEGGDRKPLPIERLAGGRFVIRNLEHGVYRLTAGRRQANPLEPIVPEHGTITLRVDADIENLVLRTRAAATVSGTVVFEDAPPPGAFLKLSVHARSEALLGLAIPVQGTLLSQQATRVREDGTFQLGGILGASRLAVSGQPPGWVVKSITYRGRDVMDAAAEFESTADARDVAIVLTSRVARVVGRVVATGARPRLAVLLTADRTRWTSRAAIVTTAGIQEDGSFEFPAVPAGAYHVAATGNMNAVLVFGPQITSALERLAAQGTEVVVGEGERRQLTLNFAGDR